MGNNASVSLVRWYVITDHEALRDLAVPTSHNGMSNRGKPFLPDRLALTGAVRDAWVDGGTMPQDKASIEASLHGFVIRGTDGRPSSYKASAPVPLDRLPAALVEPFVLEFADRIRSAQAALGVALGSVVARPE